MGANTPPVATNVEVMPLREGFIKAVIAEFHAERTGDYAGGELIERMDQRLKAAGIHTPYLASLSMRIGFLTGHMDNIDGDVMQEIMDQILNDKEILAFLENPEIVRALATSEGMSQIITALAGILESSTSVAEVPEDKDIDAGQRITHDEVEQAARLEDKIV